MVIVRRDTGEKLKVKSEGAVKAVAKLMKTIQKDLFKRNKAIMKERIFTAKSYEQFKEHVGKGFVKVNWCGSAECEAKIKADTTATNRVIPFDEKKKGKCVYCGTETETIAYFAKSY